MFFLVLIFFGFVVLRCGDFVVFGVGEVDF